MRRIPPKLLVASILLPFLMGISYAATKSGNIQIAVGQLSYVNLKGTVVGAFKHFTVDEIKPNGNRRKGPWLKLGTLGLNSNVSGNCDLEFTSLNNFKLRHTQTNIVLSKYRLKYKNNRITRQNNRITVGCNINNKPLRFQSIGKIQNRVIDAGVYRDVLTITVTAP